MTDMAQGAMPEASASPSPQINTAPVESAPAPQQTSADRVFKQSEVNEIVGRAKKEAVERYQRLQTEQPEYFQQKYAEPARQPAQPQPQPSLTEDDIKRMTASEVQRLREQFIEEQQRNAVEADARKVATEFYGKFNRGESKYQDWKTVTANVDLSKIPDIVQYANAVDNTEDVMYDILNNKVKMWHLRALAQIDPQFALDEVKRLSDSIKTNQAGQQYQPPRDPLSQMRPSNQGADTGQKREVRDYRRNPLYRG